MSQKPPASRPASNSPPAGQKITLPPVQLRDDSHYGGRGGDGKAAEFLERSLTAPTQSAQTGHNTPSGDGWRPAPLRDLGVHSILNPTESERAPTDHRSMGVASQSPSLAARASPQFGVSPTTAPSNTFPIQPAPPSDTSSSGDMSGNTLSRTRAILTPRSPSRAFSAVRGAGGQFIDATRSPFLSGRSRTYEMQSESDTAATTTPPLTTGQPQAHYGFPAVPRRASAGTTSAAGHSAPSQTASPSISASSQNPSSSQTSPAAFSYQRGPTAPPTTTPYFPGSSFASMIQPGGGLQFRGDPATTEGPYSSQALSQSHGGPSLHPANASSSRQNSSSDNNIQVLTITTSEGRIDVPVDVHQASKLADEKRKRNAGASARFRQRRKDKEKEASTNIEKLNQRTTDLERRVREVEQERDWYRAERDRLRDIVHRTPETRHHVAQAPPSPRSLHSAPYQPPLGGSHQLGGSTSMGYPPGPTSPQERAPRRRRTDVHGEFANVPYTGPPTSANLPPVQNFARQPAPSLPPLRIDNPQLPRGSSSNLGTPSSEAPPPKYPSFSQSPYERGWPAGEGPRR